MSRYRIVSIAAITVIAIGVLMLPVPAETGPRALPALALTVFIFGLLATASLPEIYTSLSFFILALVFQVAPPEVVFSGLRSSAFWLIFGGVIIGVAAGNTGLGRFMAHFVSRRLGHSYPRLIAGIVFGAIALAFLIPAAIARIIILMPVVLALADQVGLKPGSKGRTGMALAVTVACFYMPMAILPSNLPNVILAGMAESIYGIKITYGVYLLMHFPVAGVLKSVLLIALLCVMFPDSVSGSAKVSEEAPRIGPDGRRLVVILGCTLVAWGTDFLHGIAPGWVAMSAASVCMLPRIGVLKPTDFKSNLGGFLALFNIATVLALGAVVATTGAGKLIADVLLGATNFTPGDAVYGYATFSGISIFMSLFATLPGTIAVLAPFAGEVATASGLPLLTVLMLLANGYSTVFFPYQAPPILAGLRLGGVSLADGSRLTFVLSLVTLLVLLPINFFWWRLLGYIP